MSFIGIGGVSVWARRRVVDRHRWMSVDEFILDSACRGAFGFCWRYLTKIGRQERRGGG
jgi:hypothetical protein